MPSKFDGIFDGAKERAIEEPPPSPAPGQEAKQKASPSPVHREEQPPASNPVRRGPGRPPGKKSDKDFVQVTIYIKDETHRAVKRALLAEPRKSDFSGVVEEALGRWLRSRS